MATGFKKREVSAARAAVVEAVAASAPIVGNARMGASDPNLGSSQGASKPSVQNLGSSQDRSGAYQVGMVYDVPLSLIKSNPVNPRAVYTSAAVDAMAERRVVVFALGCQVQTAILAKPEVPQRAERGLLIVGVAVELGAGSAVGCPWI